MTWRQADEADLLDLMELERDANVAALGHVFPGPFPEDDVLARWAIMLDSGQVRVDVVHAAGGLVAVAAYDDSSLRQLAVHPTVWGNGLARQGVQRAIAAIGAGATLWCLEQNYRARGLYEHLGWSVTGHQQECVWPPHPKELEYVHGSTVERRQTSGTRT